MVATVDAGEIVATDAIVVVDETVVVVADGTVVVVAATVVVVAGAVVVVAATDVVVATVAKRVQEDAAVPAGQAISMHPAVTVVTTS